MWRWMRFGLNYRIIWPKNPGQLLVRLSVVIYCFSVVIALSGRNRDQHVHAVQERILKTL